MQFYESSAQNPKNAEDFCSIIIEAHKKRKMNFCPQKARRCPRDVLSWSRN